MGAEHETGRYGRCQTLFVECAGLGYTGNSAGLGYTGNTSSTLLSSTNFSVVGSLVQC